MFLSSADVVNFYIGCMFKFTYNNGCVVYAKLRMISDGTSTWGDCDFFDEGSGLVKANNSNGFYEIHDIRKDGRFELILTSIHDLTKKQNKDYLNLCYKVVDLVDGRKVRRYADTPLSMRYLFINNIDAFDLIENGMAIDKQTVLHIFK